ncbi:trypsin-like peptidase domain-containing protein [Pseudonocardia charpentierae]|uniref:Trypsin-like peptidase domain-containing protein n=1 Tax=Pseudonocardia charpentierae TaxID=3075545 RepID=A0ABU2NI18_9PSEU|nr:trypsin-like peptidase domain-containing protein [Pseudonocardia sp. DSM 45834]MDT0353610.1 trypsin-like peptidase domain-containing protein [Pseudonocardia sp. DSM 45834]
MQGPTDDGEGGGQRVQHFLDTLPFDLSRRPAQELWALLADTYYRDTQVEALLRKTGIRPAVINWSGSTELTWADVLVKSRNQNLLRPLLQVVADGGDTAVAARIKELVGPDSPTESPEAFAGDLAWRDTPTGTGDEIQILAESTLLDVAFLRRGFELATGVCRLLVTNQWGQKAHGTGFRIGERLVLTNHHVLFSGPDDGVPPRSVDAWFGYERGFDGAELAYSEVPTRAGTARGERTHDWAVIELDADPPEGTAVISLSSAKPPEPGDRVYVIQHPHGGPKKIGMIHNEIRHVDDDIVQYRTDTAAGSSGSPVFDERWCLVALHHRYVTHRTNGGIEYRNQGRRIERVAEALAASRIGV